MAEVGFARRVAPAVLLGVAGGILLFLLPSGSDADTSASEDLGGAEGAAFPSSEATTGSTSATASAGPGAATAAASAASSQRVIKGDTINFRFGTVRVKILLDGKTIKNIATLDAPGGSYQRYTDRAIPGMKAEILAAQSTKVAAVSGATYTSKAYAASVQSALDKA